MSRLCALRSVCQQLMKAHHLELEPARSTAVSFTLPGIVLCSTPQYPITDFFRGLSASSSLRCSNNNDQTNSKDDRQHAAGTASTSGQAQHTLGGFRPEERRIAMVYTCTKCDTRSAKTFSRRSYERGVVLVRCSGCNNLHLVADHLGWFGDHGFQIEQLQGEGIQVVRHSGENAGAQLTAEDVAGWSKVKQLIEAVSESSEGTRRTPGSATRLGDVEVSDALEVEPEHVGQWQKVQQQQQQQEASQDLK